MRAVGDEHPDTATEYNNLAFIYYARCDYEKASELWKKALLINEKVFGPSHPRTIGTKRTIETSWMLDKGAPLPPIKAKKFLYFVFGFWVVVSALLWWWAFGGENPKWYAIVLASVCTLLTFGGGLLAIIPGSSKKK